jgi:hypothetical protein
MRKLLGVALGVLLLLASATNARAASIALFDWGINKDGAIRGPGDSLPPGLDPNTGLGTFAIHVTGVGQHDLTVFVDHEIDEAINTFFNEIGSANGIPGAGLSWEIDEPGFTFGDIYDNFKTAALDNSVGTADPEDVSMALGWNFLLGAGQTANVTFRLTTTRPAGGFYLRQSDPGSQADIYFASGLDIRGGGTIPEPSMLLLLGVGLASIRGRRSRR